jgi:prepilin signal peptidase PulO-like enzyme (type II secretory pathway)
MIAFYGLLGAAFGWMTPAAADALSRFTASGTPPQITPTPRLMIPLAAFSGLAFAYLGWRFELSLDLLAMIGLFAFFLLVAVIDLKYRLILNVMIYPAIIAVVLVQLLWGVDDPRYMLVGGMLAFSIFYLTALLKPGQLGSGDVKLAALIGFLFGFPQVLWALLLAVFAGGAAVVILLASKRGTMQTYIPYAPFLCFGAMAALLLR